MKTQRRSLLKGLLALLPFSFSRLDAGVPTGGALEPGPTFRAVIDTFIPADQTPGAVELGIDRSLLAKIESNSDYLGATKQALTELQRLAIYTHGQGFALLSLEQRTELLQSLMASPADNRIYSLLNSLLLSTITRYYTSDTAFEMLDYHPPARGGYPDYARSLD